MINAPTKPVDDNEPALLGYCRAGFESELLQEFIEVARSPAKHAVAAKGSGYVHAVFPAKCASVMRSVTWSDLIFGRQCLHAHARPVALPERDRVTPIVDASIAFLREARLADIADVWVEYPDTNEGKALSKLANALQMRVASRLSETGLIRTTSRYRLHVLLTPDRQAWLAYADIPRACSWSLGVPRLRMPREAPSRSTLKLAEALYVFLGDDLERLLQPDMRAVDLGAAPGGWTWQLVHRGVHVLAVDNGALKGELVDNAMVRHLREDGFRFKPKKPVDWMVCDMVESPSRIAALVAKWMTEGWARHIIFNLKLPMKKRYEEVVRCMTMIETAAEEKGIPLSLSVKQLYHDREEVTAYVGRVSRRR
jgi:23S rRNA (cytidine2498-2'-O)-methyltransferase